jgi:hypothetical protein
MDILITDVTEMGGGNHCVAGWDIKANRMVRPLPNGSNWPSALIVRHGLVPGRLVRAQPLGKPTGSFPHLTEDVPIDVASIKASTKIFSDWLGAGAPTVAADLTSGFGGQLQWNRQWNGVKQGVHVLPGSQCGSLIGLRLARANLLFSESFNKLKATLDDGSDAYELAVSSALLKQAWRNGGVQAVTQALPTRAEVHVRVGLARPFQSPPKCYAMLNGVL